MRNKTFRHLLAFTFLAVTLVSCKKDNLAPNQIEDESGMKISLTWTLADGSSATDWADIDLYVYKGVGASKAVDPELFSDLTASFELISFSSSMPDGDYTVAVNYFDIQKNGTLNAAFEGSTVTKKYEINGTAFTTSNTGEVDFAKITKDGDRFTITKL